MDGDVSNMTQAELVAELARIKAENDALKAERGVGPISLKVSEKGGVSVYGMGRFPVTLYGEQWPKLLAEAPRILKFIEDNKAKLSTKADAKAKKEADKLAQEEANRKAVSDQYETVMVDGKPVTRRKAAVSG